jgi:putative Holliday junction resolvase
LSALTVLAFDLGEARVGVAVGNTLLREATPLAIVPAVPRETLFGEIGELLRTWQPQVLVVGLPRSASGADTPMTALCERFANQLNGRFNLPVVRVDERYSTLEAESLQREARQQGHARARNTLDDVAAAVILKRYFDEADANA